jgi:hypothetical protein
MTETLIPINYHDSSNQYDVLQLNLRKQISQKKYIDHK